MRACQTRGLAGEASARLDAEGKELQLQVVNEEQADHEHGEAGLHGEVGAKGERVEHTGDERLRGTQEVWVGGGEAEWWSGEAPPPPPPPPLLTTCLPCTY